MNVWFEIKIKAHNDERLHYEQTRFEKWYEVLFELIQTAKHPKFKEISQLIK